MLCWGAAGKQLITAADILLVDARKKREKILCEVCVPARRESTVCVPDGE